MQSRTLWRNFSRKKRPRGSGGLAHSGKKYLGEKTRRFSPIKSRIPSFYQIVGNHRGIPTG